MALPKLGEKKICFDNCGNGIAENVKKKKKMFWQFWQCNCRKKKKSFGNCGNGIAENVKNNNNNNFFGNCGNAIAENV